MCLIHRYVRVEDVKTAKDCERCEAYMELTGLAALNHRNKILAEEIIKVILKFRATDFPLIDDIVAEIRARFDYVFAAPDKKRGDSMCLFHKWVRVEDVDHSACGKCYVPPGSYRIPEEQWPQHPKGCCPHSFKVCEKCGKAVGYGSHGKLTVVPDGCNEQIKAMGGK